MKPTHIEEILAVLWFILATQTTGIWRIPCIVMGGLGLIFAVIYAIKR